MDVPQATKARIAFLNRAATDKTLVGGYHSPSPAFCLWGARGERLPLATGRLAMDDLTTTPGGGGVLPAGTFEKRRFWRKADVRLVRHVRLGSESVVLWSSTRFSLSP